MPVSKLEIFLSFESESVAHSHGKISPRVLLFLPKYMYNWEKERRFGRKGDV